MHVRSLLGSMLRPQRSDSFTGFLLSMFFSTGFYFPETSRNLWLSPGNSRCFAAFLKVIFCHFRGVLGKRGVKEVHLGHRLDIIPVQF